MPFCKGSFYKDQKLNWIQLKLFSLKSYKFLSAKEIRLTNKDLRLKWLLATQTKHFLHIILFSKAAAIKYLVNQCFLKPRQSRKKEKISFT